MAGQTTSVRKATDSRLALLGPRAQHRVSGQASPSNVNVSESGLFLV